jgi:hypothetical protein
MTCSGESPIIALVWLAALKQIPISHDTYMYTQHLVMPRREICSSACMNIITCSSDYIDYKNIYIAAFVKHHAAFWLCAHKEVLITDESVTTHIQQIVYDNMS